MDSTPIFLIILLLALLVGGGIVVAGVMFLIVKKGKGGKSMMSCGACGYPVKGSATMSCAECGADLREVGIDKPKGNRGMVIAAVVGVAVVGLFGLVCAGWIFTGNSPSAVTTTTGTAAPQPTTTQGSQPQKDAPTPKQ